jgi:hypothetical protein
MGAGGGGSRSGGVGGVGGARLYAVVALAGVGAGVVQVGERECVCVEYVYGVACGESLQPL